jgi:hypothetical protein
MCSAIDLCYQRQRLDIYRESRQTGAILRFGGPNCISSAVRLLLDFEQKSPTRNCRSPESARADLRLLTS